MEAAFVAAVLLAWWVGASPLGDISNHFTDHLRHVGESLAFLQHGFDVYRRPYGDVAADVALPCPEHSGLWGALPAPYPPLGILLFLPLGLVERAGWLAPSTSHAVAVAVLALIAAITCVAGHRLLSREPPAARTGFYVIAAPLLLATGLNGFFDVAFVLAGVGGVLALGRQRPRLAVILFTVAGGLHFRALAFAPVALVAALRLGRMERWRIFPVAFIAALILVPAAASAIVLDVSAFPLDNPLRRNWVRLAAFTAVSLAWIVWNVRLAAWITASTSTLAAALMIADPQHCWWHALVMVVPLLVAPVDGERSRHSWFWVAGWAWIVVACAIAYRDPWPPFFEGLRRALQTAAQ
jgi:hypothetical protein